MTTNFFSPLSWSGTCKNQDPVSGINISDPQHWSQLGYRDWSDQWRCLLITFYFASGQLLLIFGKDRKVKQFFNWTFWPSIWGFPSVLWIRISNSVITDLVPDPSHLSKIQRNSFCKVQYFIIHIVCLIPVFIWWIGLPDPEVIWDCGSEDPKRNIYKYTILASIYFI